MNPEPAAPSAQQLPPAPALTAVAPATKEWQLDPRRRPTIPPGFTVLADEPGRIIPARSDKDHAVDCRSHWFVLVRPQFGAPAIYVQHGGGEEHLVLSYGWERGLLDAVLAMPSDARFKLLWELMDIHRDARKQGKEAEWNEVQRAFIDGRLHKRKMPGRSAYKVWIDPPTSPPAPASGAT
jgi:hypothetical protein